MNINVFGLQWDTIGPLPFHAALHAFYYNGSFATRPYIVGRGRVWIDVVGNAPDKAFWVDVEKGDVTPEHVAHWLDARHAATGSFGGVYCNRSTLPDVLHNAGNRPFSLWLATLDNTVLPPEIFNLPANVVPVAVQAFGAQSIGFNADLSVVINGQYWIDRATTIV